MRSPQYFLVVALVALVVLALSAPAPAGVPPGEATTPLAPLKEMERFLELRLKELESQRGPDHPDVLSVKQRLIQVRAQLKEAQAKPAAAPEKFPEHPVLVQTRDRAHVLKGTTVRTLGDRQFLVGTDCGKTEYTRGDF